MKNALANLLALYRAEPVRINSIIAAAIVAGAKALGLALDEASTLAIVVTVLGILTGGELTRAKVSPAK
jgi:hypothetical protein